jgi:hypothetical protein
MKTVVLEFDAAEMAPEEATLKWLQGLSRKKKNGPQPRVRLSGGSIILETDDARVAGIVRTLKAHRGPPHLLSVLVPTANPAMPLRLEGLAFASRVSQTKKASGRRVKLNALPGELGPRYDRSMTNPDFGHHD